MSGSTTRKIGGALIKPDATPFRNASITIYRDKRHVDASIAGAVVDEVLRSQTGPAGEVSFALVPGRYLGRVHLSDGDRYFRFTVPESDGPFVIQDLLDALPLPPGQFLTISDIGVAARLWAESPDPIPVGYGGDGATSRSAKYWATKAQLASNAAQAARDASYANAEVFDDISAGLSGTSNGEQFIVHEEEEIIKYLNDDGSEVELFRLANSTGVERRFDLAMDVGSASPRVQGEFFPLPETFQRAIGFDRNRKPIVPYHSNGYAKGTVIHDFYSEPDQPVGGIIVGGRMVLRWDSEGFPVAKVTAIHDFYSEPDQPAGGIIVGGRMVLRWDSEGFPVLPASLSEPRSSLLLRAPDIAKGGNQLVCLHSIREAEPDSYKYQWFKDGVQIPGAIGPTLDITGETGVYRCKEIAVYPHGLSSEMSLPFEVGTSLSEDEQAERDAVAAFRAAAAATVPKSGPSSDAEEYAAIDLASGQPLFLKNEDRDIAIASTSKIATLILLERWADDLSETVEITSDYLGIGGTQAGLGEGDVVTLEALAYGMMLPSGNDAATAIADKIGGKMRVFDGNAAGSTAENVARFVAEMNALGSEIGGNFTFYNPSGGLGGALSNRADALSVAKLIAEAFRHPFARKVMSTKSKDVSVGGPNARTLNLTNTASTIMDDDGFEAAKTGTGGGGSSGILATVWSSGGGRFAVVVSNTGSGAARFPLTREIRDAVIDGYTWTTGWAQPTS